MLGVPTPRADYTSPADSQEQKAMLTRRPPYYLAKRMKSMLLERTGAQCVYMRERTRRPWRQRGTPGAGRPMRRYARPPRRLMGRVILEMRHPPCKTRVQIVGVRRHR